VPPAGFDGLSWMPLPEPGTDDMFRPIRHLFSTYSIAVFAAKPMANRGMSSKMPRPVRGRNHRANLSS
jgi:hypothetical protein